MTYEQRHYRELVKLYCAGMDTASRRSAAGKLLAWAAAMRAEIARKEALDKQRSRQRRAS